VLKKTIVYTDLNDEKRSEDFYFNFSIQELIDMELEVEGGMKTKLEAMVKAQDVRAMLGVLKDIVLRAIGKKTDDGKRFDKSETFRDDFYNSPAYGALLMELIGQPNAASEFMNGLMPKELMQRVNEIKKAQGVTVGRSPEQQDFEQAFFKEPKKPEDYTLPEIVAMSEEDFDRIFGTDHRKWSKQVLVAAMRRRTEAETPKEVSTT
jgi:hypothetical protein